MTEEKTHNGWTNYETWACALWLDNDEGLQETAGRIVRDSCHFETRDVAVSAVASALKGLVEDTEMGCPDLGSTLYADLLNAALSEIDYYQIAEQYIDDSDSYPTEEEEE